jgi:hypothetical protein
MTNVRRPGADCGGLQPDPLEGATVLGPVKMLWGSGGETYLSLH